MQHALLGKNENVYVHKKLHHPMCIISTEHEDDRH